MKLSVGKKANVNYLAKIVKIENFHAHSDPEVTRLKCCNIDGFNIITGIDSQPGLYVYFPTACCINPDFLRFANLYRHSELNADHSQTGMFEDNGRVKAIKLRGELSEGFIIPLVILENYVVSVTNLEFDEEIKEGTEFDVVEHNGKTFWINKKYIPKNAYVQSTSGGGKGRGKMPKGINKFVEGQFRFHYDTILIKKCPNVIKPTDLISITAKVHGASGISAYVLCKRPKKWYERVFEFLTRKEIDDTRYDYLYSSRTVIKNQFYNENVGGGFYGCDVWAEADKIVKPCLAKGMTAYYEIIGFLPNGGYIQKGYDYGFNPPKQGETYQYGKHFGVQIYRITMTNVDGVVHEFSAKEVQQWAKAHGLIPVEEYYYGYAGELYPSLDQSEHWNENFLSTLANDKTFNMECNSPTCVNKVPHEGVVIKIENIKSEAFKLKCFKFLDKEGKDLDKGETNIEDQA